MREKLIFFADRGHNNLIIFTKLLREIFRMVAIGERRANNVALHDGLHDNVGGGTSVFRAQSLQGESRASGRILQKRQCQHEPQKGSASE